MLVPPLKLNLRAKRNCLKNIAGIFACQTNERKLLPQLFGVLTSFIRNEISIGSTRGASPECSERLKYWSSIVVQLQKGNILYNNKGKLCTFWGASIS